MRLGVCASMIAPDRDPIGIASVETAARLGFDYVELSLAHLAALADADFADLAARLAASPLRCEACNNFFPPHLKLTGPAADPGRTLAYADAAMARAAELGAAVIVLGSSGAKNVPPGFPHAEARGQLLALLRDLGPLAERHGITIVLEPISRPEANFVNRASEALELVREADHPAIRLLIDYYHLAVEGESPDIVRLAGPAIQHVHFASPGGRVFPTLWEARYAPFFLALRDIDYQARLSIEAFTTGFEADAPRALALLRGATARLAP
jgi:sugar phosphate isomerase/epimerase